MTASTATIRHTIDQDILDDLETAFDGFRRRIALLSVEACGTLTSMFGPLGPADCGVIDIPVIEREQFDQVLPPAVEAPTAIELAGA